MSSIKHPAITAIIPAYNYARYLPAAIDSVLAQKYPNLELIVVDDGSTDNTRQICHAYGDQLRYIYQDNAGLSAARNTGIGNARHDLIALLDADDVWRPNLLARLQETLTDLDQDFGMVACLQLNIDAAGDILPVKHSRCFEQQSQAITSADLVLKTRFGSSGVLIRKVCFATAGLFDTSLTSSEDRDMWLRILKRYRIYLLAEELTLVRKHSVSMSRKTTRMKANMQQVLTNAYRNGYYPKHKIYFWMRVFAHFRHETACMYFDEKNILKAITDELCSMLICPIFLRASDVNEKPFFRIRHLIYFLKSFIFRNH